MKSGAAHARERKLLSSAFHGERMRACAEAIRDATAAQVARLQPGETFVVQEVARAITLQVILRAVFGVEETCERERVAAAVCTNLHNGETTEATESGHVEHQPHR